MSNLLAQAPALIQSGYLLGAPLIESPSQGEQVAQHSPVVVAGAQLRDGQGKIVANGKLHPVNGLKTVAAVTAVWQVMAIVTAQVHLSEINARLMLLVGIAPAP